jgi:hypothetical protein
MKKSVKKMSLSRETLGELDPKHLAQVQGRQINTRGCVLSVNICSNHETCSTCVPEQTAPFTVATVIGQ